MADDLRVERGPDGPHSWTVRTSDGATATRRPVMAALDEHGNVWLWMDGRSHVVPAPRSPAPAAGGRQRPGPAPDALVAPMPATVVRVSVTRGDRVDTGDTLLLLEAMKMEMPLRAPRSGVVAEVRCAAGDLVQPGVPLVVLEDEPDDDA